MSEGLTAFLCVLVTLCLVLSHHCAYVWGKTEQMLALIVACATGIFPDSMKHRAASLFRGPIHVRICCESITTVLYPVMLPKLQFWKWTGTRHMRGENEHR